MLGSFLFAQVIGSYLYYGINVFAGGSRQEVLDEFAIVDRGSSVPR